MRQACEAAESMLADATVDTVIISSMQQEPPVRESWTHVAGIVLAAGKPTRLRRYESKLFHGTTQRLAAHSVRMALDAGLDPVIVVLGLSGGNDRKVPGRAACPGGF